MNRAETKALRVGASLLTLALPMGALAGTITVVSDTSWNVFTTHPTSPMWLGLAQSVCLNTTNPANCLTPGLSTPTLYGYPSVGWTANAPGLPASARWMWAPNITGSSSPAASQEFVFQKDDVYVCNPPEDATISVAADDFAEVSVNGTVIPASTSTSHSAFTTFTVPASSIYGSTPVPPTIRPNMITIKAKNGPNPPNCTAGEYKCNPAGVVFWASFKFTGNPTCNAFVSGGPATYTNGQSEKIADCPAGQSGSVYHVCVCGAWTPNITACVSRPQCTGTSTTSAGMRFEVDAVETQTCPAGQSASPSSHKCLSTGTWDVALGQCAAPPPPAPRCTGRTQTFAVGDTEALPCVVGTGSASRTCQAGGTWGSTTGGCTLAEGAICGSRNTPYIQACPPGSCIANCPAGTECKARPVGRGPLVTADWFCDR